jgi:hypothetical protein
MDLQNCALNCAVTFQKRDVFIPEPREMLFELHGNESIVGKIVGFSDGSVPKEFAVIEVEGMTRPLMVPRLLLQQVPLPEAASDASRNGNHP